MITDYRLRQRHAGLFAQYRAIVSLLISVFTAALVYLRLTAS
jgi:hypothetical protein